MPTLCHYFYDFKEDSERAGLVLGNAKYILLGVLNGLKHLHSLRIMHRDIKCEWRGGSGGVGGSGERMRLWHVIATVGERDIDMIEMRTLNDWCIVDCTLIFCNQSVLQ